MGYVFDCEQYGNFQFVTVDDEGKIGSIYYQYGRIRLIHKGGPGIGSLDKKIFRFSIPKDKATEIQADLERYKSDREKYFKEKYKMTSFDFEILKEEISKEYGYKSIEEDSPKGSVLFELSPDLRYHVSRGMVIHDAILDYNDKEFQNVIVSHILKGVNTTSHIKKYTIDILKSIHLSNCLVYQYFKLKNKEEAVHNPDEYWVLEDQGNDLYCFLDTDMKRTELFQIPDVNEWEAILKTAH